MIYAAGRRARHLLSSLVVGILVLGSPTQSFAELFTWSGEASDGFWTNPGNWREGIAKDPASRFPQTATDTAEFDLEATFSSPSASPVFPCTLTVSATVGDVRIRGVTSTATVVLIVDATSGALTITAGSGTNGGFEFNETTLPSAPRRLEVSGVMDVGGVFKTVGAADEVAVPGGKIIVRGPNGWQIDPNSNVDFVTTSLGMLELAADHTFTTFSGQNLGHLVVSSGATVEYRASLFAAGRITIDSSSRLTKRGGQQANRNNQNITAGALDVQNPTGGLRVGAASVVALTGFGSGAQGDIKLASQNSVQRQDPAASSTSYIPGFQNLTIQTGGTITAEATTAVIEVGGTFACNGTFELNGRQIDARGAVLVTNVFRDTPASGLLRFIGSGAADFTPGAGDYGSVQVVAGKTVTLFGNLQLQRDLNVQGALAAQDDAIIFKGSVPSAVTISASTLPLGLLRVTKDSTTTEVTLDGTVHSTTFEINNAVEVTKGTLTLVNGANLMLKGDLTIGADGRFTPLSSGTSVTFNGSSGTLTVNPSPADVSLGATEINVNSAVTLASSVRFQTLTIDVSSALNVGTHLVQVEGDLTNNGTLNGGNGIFEIGGNFNNSSANSADLDNASFKFTGTGTITSGTFELGSVTLASPAGATLGGAIEVARDLSVEAGASLNAASFPVTFGRNLDVQGGISNLAGLTFDGSGTSIGGSGKLTLPDATTVAKLSVSAAGKFLTFPPAMNGRTLKVNGNLEVSAGTLDIGSAKVEVHRQASAGDVTIAGGAALTHVSGTLTLVGNGFDAQTLTVNGALSLGTDGTLALDGQGSDQTIDNNGSFVIGKLDLDTTSSAGTVTLKGTLKLHGDFNNPDGRALAVGTGGPASLQFVGANSQTITTGDAAFGGIGILIDNPNTVSVNGLFSSSAEVGLRQGTLSLDATSGHAFGSLRKIATASQLDATITAASLVTVNGSTAVERDTLTLDAPFELVGPVNVQGDATRRATLRLESGAGRNHTFRAGVTVSPKGTLLVAGGTGSGTSTVQFDQQLALSGSSSVGARFELQGTTDASPLNLEVLFKSGISVGAKAEFVVQRNDNPTTLKFAGTSTVDANAASFILQGKANSPGDRLLLRSITNGTQWVFNYNIVPSSTVDTFQFLDVRDSNASGGQTVFATDSLNSGNNLNWNFGGEHTITGTLRDATGNALAGKQVKLVVKQAGGLQSLTTPTDNNGKFTFQLTLENDGDPFVLLADDENGAILANTAGIAVTTTANPTTVTIDLRQGRLEIVHTGTGSTVTQADLDGIDVAAVGDTDVLFEVDGSGNLIVSGNLDLLGTGRHGAEPEPGSDHAPQRDC